MRKDIEEIQNAFWEGIMMDLSKRIKGKISIFNLGESKIIKIELNKLCYNCSCEFPKNTKQESYQIVAEVLNFIKCNIYEKVFY